MRIRIDAHSVGKVGFRLAAFRAHHQVAVGVSSIILCEPSVKKTFTVKYKKCLCGKKKAKSVSTFAQSLGLLLVEKAVANIPRVLYAPDTFSGVCLSWFLETGVALMPTHGPPASASQCHHIWPPGNLLSAFFFPRDRNRSDLFTYEEAQLGGTQ